MTVSTSSSEGMATFSTRAERYAAGKALRVKAPRTSHEEWAAASDRPDPIGLLEESNRTRVPELVPIRYGRMSLSPFAFLRGSAIVMASDLAKTPISGIKVQVCGDAHLSNFGFFATPERNLVFDVNDFDETLPGPWEWDLKRLAASIVVAGRQNGYTAQENMQSVVSSIQQYHTLMQQMASMSALDVWYQHIDMREIMGLVKRKEQERLQKQAGKASRTTSLRAFPKMAEVVDGHYRIKDEPPLIVHVEDLGDVKKTQEFEAEWIKNYFAAYLETLPSQRTIKTTLRSGPHFLGVGNGSATAIFGLLPAALSTGIGSDTQKPFAIVVVAGLISRLFLGFFVNPVLYEMVAKPGDVLQV